VHAAGESATQTVPRGTIAVVLAVENIQKLLALERKLKDSCIPHTLICEPDHPHLGDPMAIGISPTTKNTVSGILKSLSLLK
jgi:hypothetical protein